jgi:hypothetical protein
MIIASNGFSSGWNSWPGEFAVDVIGFSVMSNHFHLILRNRPDVVDQWVERIKQQREDLNSNQLLCAQYNFTKGPSSLVAKSEQVSNSGHVPSMTTTRQQRLRLAVQHGRCDNSPNRGSSRVSMDSLRPPVSLNNNVGQAECKVVPYVEGPFRFRVIDCLLALLAFSLLFGFLSLGAYALFALPFFIILCSLALSAMIRLRSESHPADRAITIAYCAAVLILLMLLIGGIRNLMLGD